jgi:amidase
MNPDKQDPSPVAPEQRMARRTVVAGGLSLLASSNNLAALVANPLKAARGDTLHYTGLMELAQRIRNRDLSPVEVTKAQLARIATLDSGLNAYELVMSERALAQARRAEAEIQSGRYRGPLHGVPVAVKDLFFVRGLPTKGGCRALANFVPDYDATAVSRLERAGAVLLGKLALTEGAMVGYHRDFKVPRNPWGARLWPGFSSSGSGVGTAAGLCYASLGTDTGGSIRFPSAANGIVGLKPTWGRVSRHGVLALAPSLDHVGPMTRRVADAAAVLGVIAGYDPEDPTSLSGPAPDYLKELQRGIKGVRLGFDEVYTTQGVLPHVVEAVRQAVRDLEKLGTHVVPVKMPTMTEPVLSAWETLCAAEAVAAHEATFPSRADDYGVFFRKFLETGRTITGAAYAKASSLRAEFVGRLRQAFQHIDVLACPTMPTEAFAYDPEKAYGGFDAAANTLAGADVRYLEDRFTLPYDYSGYPTLSLPCGVSPGGLPLSLQLAGHPLSEALLCRVGHAYENATEWHRHHPPV